MSKLSARPDSGDRWCVMSLDFHSPATQRPLSSQQPQQSGEGAGAEGQGSGVWGVSGAGVWGTGGGGAAAAGPALESLFVVTESQTLSFNIQTGLKVRTWWWVGEGRTSKRLVSRGKECWMPFSHRLLFEVGRCCATAWHGNSRMSVRLCDRA